MKPSAAKPQMHRVTLISERWLIATPRWPVTSDGCYRLHFSHSLYPLSNFFPSYIQDIIQILAPSSSWKNKPKKKKKKKRRKKERERERGKEGEERRGEGKGVKETRGKKRRGEKDERPYVVYNHWAWDVDVDLLDFL